MRVPRLEELTLDQRIGQLFLARTPKLCAQLATQFSISEKDIDGLIDNGLVCGFYAGRDTTLEEIDEYQKRSPIPLLIATDIETGAVAADMAEVTPLPMQLAMAAFASEKEVYEWARIAAIETRGRGFNYAFGPVVDLALDPESTLVGLRTFGNNIERVARFGAVAVKGYQDHGLLVSAKHYPGFGGSPDDAHIRMCEIPLSRKAFIAREIEVYRRLVKKVDLSGVMSGHIFVPSVDKKDCATTSKKIVDLLRGTGFDGVLITDSLAMKGLKMRVSSKYAHQGALASGHDIILSDYNVSPIQALEYIKAALKDGIISEKQINRSVSRVLKAKERIFSTAPGAFDRKKHFVMSERFSQKSVTVTGRFRKLDPARKYLVIVSEEFDRSMVRGELILDYTYRNLPEDVLKSKLKNARFERISECPNAETIERLLDVCVQYDDIILVAYSYPGAYKGNSHLSRPFIHLVRGIAHKIRVMVFFGLPYAVMELPKLECVIYGYLGGFAEKAAFKVLLGEARAGGKLPVKMKK